jgi:UPF0755 protein
VPDRHPPEGPNPDAGHDRPLELFDGGGTASGSPTGPAASAGGPRADEWADDEWADDGDDGDWVDDDAYVPVRAERPGGRRWLAAVLAFLLVIAVGLGATALWVRSQIDPGDPGEEIALTIPSGATTGDIARLLEEKDVITNPTIFEWYLRFAGGGPFKAGDYEGLRVKSSMGDVIDLLDRGPAPPKVVPVTFREGLWLSETRDLILQTFPDMDPAALDAALAAVRAPIMPEDAESAEGVLFPATYEVPLATSTDPNVVLGQMLQAFESVAAEQGLGQAPARLEGAAGRRQITPYEALIVASLVESEARTEGDRAKIARVIYNRMKEGMRLDIDATVLYALGDRGAELTQSQLNNSSPYNTRRVTGLPPTPINSPGEASIEAALNPAEGEWLFYVLADEEGNHEFTNTLSEHNAAVARAREKGLL